ncbi:EAL domain-containing protein [Clostridium carnis]
MSKSTKKNFVSINMILLITVIIIIIITSTFINIVSSILSEETKEYITELSRKNAIAIENRIYNNYGYTKSIANHVTMHLSYGKESVLKYLKLENSKSSFLRMGIIDINGIGYSTEDKVEDLSKEEYFLKSINGEGYISSTFVDPETNKNIMLYSVPIINEGKVDGVLYVIKEAELLNHIASFKCFNEKGYSKIINKNGDVILSSESNNEDKLYKNIFSNPNLENIDKVNKTVDELANDLQDGKNGIRLVVKDKDKTFISYTKLNIEKEWYSLVAVPYDVAFSNVIGVIRTIMYLVLLIFLVFLLTITYIIIYRNKIEKKLEKMAFVDEVTGENNLTKFKIDAKKVIKSKGNKKLAIIQLDVDKFKLINEMRGYKIGNEAIKHMSRVLKESLIYNELYCRIQDDLFLILMEYKDDEDIIKRIEEIDNKIHSYSVENKFFQGFLLAFGVYRIVDTKIDLNLMIDYAGAARKTVKNNFNNHIAFYDIELKEKLIEEKEMENCMYNALGSGEFKLYLQPKYDMNKNKLIGAEALARWDNPEKGIISPNKFIPVFEKNGFIINLDIYMLKETCRYLRKWMDENIDLIPISINISRVHLNNIEYFLSSIKEIIYIYQIPPNLIEIEITESIIFEDSKILIYALNKLKEIGFKISLDDFGSGYSSLNMLKDIPIDIIKLDRLFLKGKSESEKGKIIISNIVKMAKELNLGVISEGVETIDQANFLKSIGCNLVQGYLYAKPMTVTDFEKKQLKIINEK